MRISDWSSDVCSSDLRAVASRAQPVSSFDFPLRLVVIVVASVGPGGGQPWARRTGRMARTAEPARIVHDRGCARRARGGRPYQTEGRITDKSATKTARTERESEGKECDSKGECGG